jgi:hypothetical protein
VDGGAIQQPIDVVRVTNVHWELADARYVPLTPEGHDIVIAYGLLHCLESLEQVADVVMRLQRATRPGGFHVICAFNSRRQELDAHPGFCPVLLAHDAFLSMYSDWKVIFESDEDLHETHPHNNIPHTHSLTRLIAQKES